MIIILPEFCHKDVARYYAGHDDSDGGQNMSKVYDFSDINLQYLLRLRDLAQQNRQITSPLLGIPDEFVANLSEITPKEFAYLAQIKTPLLVPRPELWWWNRLFSAIQHGHIDEINAVAEHLYQLSTLIREEDKQ